MGHMCQNTKFAPLFDNILDAFRSAGSADHARCDNRSPPLIILDLFPLCLIFSTIPYPDMHGLSIFVKTESFCKKWHSKRGDIVRRHPGQYNHGRLQRGRVGAAPSIPACSALSSGIVPLTNLIQWCLSSLVFLREILWHTTITGFFLSGAYLFQ
jgi:hypothetical protein